LSKGSGEERAAEGTRMASIVLLNLGGPATLADVRPFLKNLFSDPLILDLPGGRLIRPFLAWMILTFRSRKVRGYYARIGGGSPLLRLTLAQAAALREELRRRGYGTVRVEVAMRYAEPGAATALRKLRSAGQTRVIALPLYPQECVATTTSSVLDLEAARDAIAPDLAIDSIRSYHLHSGYLAAVASRIREALDRLPAPARGEAVLLFSAHGVPESLPKRGDPYVGQIRETVEALRALVGPQYEHRLAFQSRAGPVRWVGPPTDSVIAELAGRPAVVIVPISFVSDHIETLYEIDLLFGGLAREAGIQHFVRCESLNDSPIFTRAMADLVEPLLQDAR
jgi:protoporphyrin/coproporphyrin ferrochelatase